MSKMGNLMIDQMNNERIVILHPDEEWTPGMFTGEQCPIVEQVKEKKPEDCRVHDWVEVLLFRTTVTECKKCGKLKE